MVPSGKRHPLHLWCAVLVAILVAQSVRAQTLSADLWITNGPVNTIEVSNGLVYLGGAFNQVGPPHRRLIWDGRRAGEPIAAGVYLVRCESPTRTTLRRLVVVP